MTPRLYLREVKGKGRGVFSRDAIVAGDPIESAPAILVPAGSDSETLRVTRLNDYCFRFDRQHDALALVMGFGSLYNHALQPNAGFTFDTEGRLMNYFALRDIPAHAEICINYGGAPGEACEAWFRSRAIVPR